MAEVYPHPKMNFWKWIENVWYYYKWFILLGAVVLTGVVIACSQILSRVDPDASLLYVGPRAISDTRCGEIAETVQNCMTSDPNGDGKKKVNIETVTLSTEYASLIGNERPGQTEYDAYMDYNNQILAGDACILLLDPLFYEQLEKDGALMPLSEALDEVPAAAGRCGIRLDELPLYRLDGFKALAPETVLCFRFASTYSIPDETERASEQNRQLSVFRDLFAAV